LVKTLRKLGPQLDRPAVLFPCGDTDVLAVSQHRDELSRHYRFLLPEPQELIRLMDKTRFAVAALEMGLPIPATGVVACLGDLEEAGSKVRFPCVVKPWRVTPEWESASNFRKAIQVGSMRELRHLYETICGAEPRILVQEWVDGRDEDICATFVYLNRESEPLLSFSSRKLRQWPPLVGNTSATVPHSDPELERQTISILQRLRLRGLGSIEWKRDSRSGRYLIIEPTVGRCDLNSPVSLLWGLNFPMVAYQDAVGLTVPPMTARPRRGCWVQEENELFSVLHSMRHGQLKLGDWRRSLRGKVTCAYWSWRDPIPGAKLASNLVCRALRRVVNRLANGKVLPLADGVSLKRSANSGTSSLEISHPTTRPPEPWSRQVIES
jgi:predicted ATP-grasp superfamily ATP-dependent carboligase